MRDILARFLFTGDMVHQPVATLSGGEKAKLALAALMLSGANTLLLDEPTNHLDIPSREAVEDALAGFPGTVIAISHDRYFLNRIATRIAELTPSGLTLYAGNYDYYTEKKSAAGTGRAHLKELADMAGGGAGGPVPSANEAPAGSADQVAASAMQVSAAAEERRRRKREETERRRREKAAAEAERRVTELEEKIAGTEKALEREEVITDHQRLSETAERLDTLRRNLETAYAAWEKAESALHSK
jgi:ATP-binding cassette subfamily F protein 3